MEGSSGTCIVSRVQVVVAQMQTLVLNHAVNLEKGRSRCFLFAFF